jgi:porin
MTVSVRYSGLVLATLIVLGDSGSDAFGGQPIDPATLPPTQAIDVSPGDRLFGDWGGLQNDLIRQGIGLRFDAVTEFAGNVSGGTQQTSSFANQVGVDLDINWERLAGVTGLSTHVIIVNRSGSSISRAFGDNLLPVQEIYGSGGDVAFHLVSAYAQETLMDGRLDFAIGRMNVENDFASSPLYCFFMNNGLCGDPKALPGGDIGHSAYPDAAWALRLRGRPVPEVYAEAGVYEVNQGMYSYKNFRSGFKFDTSQDSGVYVPVEVAWEPEFGRDQLPGHYKLGFGYDNSGTYKDFTNPLAEAALPGYRSGRHSGNTQYWALADQMLIRNGDGGDLGLIALAGYILNDPNNTVYADQYFAGFIDRGFWKYRPRDSFEMLFIYVTASDRIAKVQAIEQAHGLPLSGGATGIQTHEILLEADYRMQVVDGMTFMPDFQYVIRPNAQSNIPHATVFGFRAYVDF